MKDKLSLTQFVSLLTYQQQMPMNDYKKILILENQMEAQRLDAILDEENIPHVVRSYHDSVYNGIFQAGRGWGSLEAPEEYKEKIEAIYEKMREGDEESSE